MSVSYSSIGNEISVRVSVGDISNRDKLSLLRTLLIEVGIIDALVLDEKKGDEAEFTKARAMIDQKFADFWSK